MNRTKAETNIEYRTPNIEHRREAGGEGRPIPLFASPEVRNSVSGIRPLWFTILSILFILSKTLVGAGEATPLPPATEDGLFAFANKLRDDADYYRAITEYQRLLFHFPKSPRAEGVRLEIARCYARAERWKEAKAEYAKLAGDLAGKESGRRALAEQADVLFAAGEFQAAAAAYDEFAYDYAQDPRADAARWRRAWSFLLGHEFGRAQAAFAAIGPPSPHAAAAAELARECRRLARRSTKSPLLAGVLAIVPGLGHFYDGRYMDGVAALVVNGTLGWGAASGFEAGATAAGAVLGLVGLNFYAGSIVGAVNWSHRVNRSRAEEQIDALRRKHGI